MSDDWDITRKGVGALSIWLGTGAVFAPRVAARLLGVDPAAAEGDRALPLLVRLIAARNIAMGVALLVSPRPPARRTTEVALVLAGVDAAAVLTARSGGDVSTLSPVLSGTVLAAAVVSTVHWRRFAGHSQPGPVRRAVHRQRR